METPETLPKNTLAQEAAYAAVIEHIKQHSGVTVVEILKILNKCGVPAEGDQALHLPDYENILLWLNLSTEAAVILSRVMGHPNCTCVPTRVLTYMIDGTIPSLPLARSARQYVKPRWLPVVWNWVPSP